MLKFRVKGRMGNQMFIYAFAKCFQLENPHISLFFDDYLDLRNFKLTGNDRSFIQFINKVKFRLLTGSPNEKKTVHLNDCMQTILTDQLCSYNNVLIDGYFQSYIPLSSHRKNILEWFSPKEELKKSFDSKYKNILMNEKILAVHIRRTDYVSGGYDYGFLQSTDLSLPVNYFLNALEAAGSNQFDRIIFMSDDINYVREKFSHIPGSYFSEENAMTDLQLLMNASSCIIANSTFSWWGAWLNQFPGKRVYAPENFLGFRAGFEFPKNILPPEWVKISANA